MRRPRLNRQPVRSRADVRETQYLIESRDDGPFCVFIEPEAAQFDFPPNEKVLLTFRTANQTSYIEMTHATDCLTIWRSGDTEVWATMADGTSEQVAGFSGNPAPWLDSNHSAEGPAPWTWPPAPDRSD